MSSVRAEHWSRLLGSLLSIATSRMIVFWFTFRSVPSQSITKKDFIIIPLSTMASTHYCDHSPNAIGSKSSNKGASVVTASEPSANCGGSSKKARSQPGTVAVADFQPSNYSVVCGRLSKESSNHAGNRHFRFLTAKFIARYSRADTKAAKSVIVSEIITMIRQVDGNFCINKSGVWFEVGECYARGKVTALLRDMLHTQYRSSTKAKNASRRVRNQNKKQENQRSRQQLRDDAGEQLDDNSVSSSCWGSNNDSLVIDYPLEHDYFDMEVF